MTPRKGHLLCPMVITGANVAGIDGAQPFCEDDERRDRRAFSVNCAILAFGLSLAIFRFADDVRYHDRKSNKPAL